MFLCDCTLGVVVVVVGGELRGWACVIEYLEWRRPYCIFDTVPEKLSA